MALDILDRDGAKALTMRTLAERLGITPMTIYHRVGTRDGLIRAIAEKAYSGVVAPETGEARQRIEDLMISYHAQVVKHPGLTLVIFSNPTVFPDQARRISDDLIVLLQELGMSQPQAQIWLHILVDFAHGAGLATAMNRPKGTSGTLRSGGEGYADALTTLLDCIGSASQPLE